MRPKVTVNQIVVPSAVDLIISQNSSGLLQRSSPKSTDILVKRGGFLSSSILMNPPTTSCIYVSHLRRLDIALSRSKNFLYLWPQVLPTPGETSLIHILYERCGTFYQQGTIKGKAFPSNARWIFVPHYTNMSSKIYIRFTNVKHVFLDVGLRLLFEYPNTALVPLYLL